MSWSTRQSITKRLLVTVLGLLCTQVCGVTAAEVEQRPPALSLQEGASSTLQCNFSTTPANVQWYRQDPGGRLSLLFSVPSGTKQHGRLNSTTVAKERRSSLYISSSQTADSATYFCAMEPQCSPGTCSLCTNPPWGLAPPPAAVSSGAHRTAHHSAYECSGHQTLAASPDLGLPSPSSLLNPVSLFLHYKPLTWHTRSSNKKTELK
uniref:Ig-like domain-containing protein n=1 Tax=Ursus americanus TaxID=9643 RepID=A0A452QEE0_URSAM